MGANSTLKWLAPVVCTVGLALSGCGDNKDQPEARRSTTTSSEASAVDRASFVVEAEVRGAYRMGAVHVVRVERPDGSRVFERALDASMKTSEQLAPGDYRVLSFQRECRTSRCGPTAPTGDLGEPVEICGTYFTVAAEKQTLARIVVIPEDGCTITLS